MVWVAKAKRHVAVYVQKTVGGNTQYVKRRPGIITSIAADAAPVVRVRHYGETYGNGTNGVVRNTTLAPPRNGKYVGG